MKSYVNNLVPNSILAYFHDKIFSFVDLNIMSEHAVVVFVMKSS